MKNPEPGTLIQQARGATDACTGTTLHCYGFFVWSEIPRYDAILAAVDIFISAPCRKRIIVGCGTPVHLANSEAE